MVRAAANEPSLLACAACTIHSSTTAFIGPDTRSRRSYEGRKCDSKLELGELAMEPAMECVSLAEPKLLRDGVEVAAASWPKSIVMTPCDGCQPGKSSLATMATLASSSLRTTRSRALSLSFSLGSAAVSTTSTIS